MTDQLIIRHHPTVALQGSTGPSGLYAIVLNEDDQALMPAGGGNWSMQSYVAANQNTASIVLLQSSIRTRSYERKLLGSILTMPTNRYGEQYTLEVWEHPGTGVPNRATDIFHYTERFSWAGTRRLEIKLDYTQEQIICMASVAYDPTAATAHVIVWLDKNGRRVTNPASTTVTWKKRDGSSLATGNSVTPDANGYFIFDISNVQLDPDTNYTLLTQITDADGLVHSTDNVLNAWD